MTLLTPPDETELSPGSLREKPGQGGAEKAEGWQAVGTSQSLGRLSGEMRLVLFQA